MSAVVSALLAEISDDDLDALAARLRSRLAPPAESPGPLMTVEQVAAHLAVDAEWVRRHQADLGGFKLSPGQNGPVRFRLADVERALEERRLRPSRSAARGWRDDPDWATA
jgi:hypothetical protein